MGRKWIGALVATAVLLSAGAVLARTVYVKSRFAKLYDGTTFAAKPVSRLVADTALQVLGEDKSFFKVKAPDGQQGFVPKAWVADSQRSKSTFLASMGKAARGGDSKDVSYTAGARGLSAEAEGFAAGKAGAAEAAADIKRVEQLRISDQALDDFLAAGKLGDHRFFGPPPAATVRDGAPGEAGR